LHPLVDTEMKTHKTNAPSCDCLPLFKWVSPAIHDGEPVLIMSINSKLTPEEKRLIKIARGKAYRKNNPEKKAASAKAWRDKNKEKIREHYKEWAASNPGVQTQRSRNFRKNNSEKVKAYKTQWRNKNRDKLAQYRKTWDAKHPGKSVAKALEWAKNNPEKRASIMIAVKGRIRAAKKSAPVGELKAIKEWAKQWKSLTVVSCHWCKDAFTPNKCQADHVMPIAKGGAHCLTNLVIACQSCNHRKSDKHPDAWLKEINDTRRDKGPAVELEILPYYKD